MLPELGLDSDSVKVSASPSSAELSPIESTGVGSLSMMVPVPVPTVTTEALSQAFVADRVKASLSSWTASSSESTRTRRAVSPAGHVTCRPSAPAAAPQQVGTAHGREGGVKNVKKPVGTA